MEVERNMPLPPTLRSDREQQITQRLEFLRVERDTAGSPQVASDINLEMSHLREELAALSRVSHATISTGPGQEIEHLRPSLPDHLAVEGGGFDPDHILVLQVAGADALRVKLDGTVCVRDTDTGRIYPLIMTGKERRDVRDALEPIYNAARMEQVTNGG